MIAAPTGIVTLSLEEIEMAALIGCKRAAESKLAGRKDKFPVINNSFWDIDVEGAMAEMAYCKYRNKFWTGSVNTFKQADCGVRTQIRSTSHQNGRLIIRNDDDDSHFYVLIVGKCPTYSIIGWIKGLDGKKQKYQSSPNNGPPAFFIPQTDLHKFD